MFGRKNNYFMKIIKSIIVLTLIIWFTQTGCKKDKTNFFLKGTIKHKYTKEPIPGLEIEISEVRPGFLGSNRTIWDRTTTNNEGEFSLKLQKTDIDYGYNVYTILPFSIDTNKLQHKFIQSNSYLTSIELRKKLNLELEPSGYISTYITNTTWDSLPADTIIISSPYSTNQIIRGQDRIFFM